MKIIESTPTQLVLREKGLGANHWGLFMTTLTGSAFVALSVAGSEVPVPVMVALVVFFTFGVIAAAFMSKRLTHRLDKVSGGVAIEYPARMNTSLEIKRFRIDEVTAIVLEKQSGSDSTPLPGHKLTYNAAGFSYRLKTGEKVEAGVFSSLVEEIDQALAALTDFLNVPVE